MRALGCILFGALLLVGAGVIIHSIYLLIRLGWGLL
jgi:hypothetical protein